MTRFLKDKSKLNLSINIVMLLLVMPIAGIGFLMKYVLIPGTQRNVLYGSNVDLAFLGLTRHQWGNVHLILSIVFLSLLILHIILHWKIITCVFQRMIPHKMIRTVFIVLLTSIGLLLISFPLFIKPEVVQKEPLHQNKKYRQIDSPVMDTLFIGLFGQNKPKSNVNSQNDNHKEHEQSFKDEYEVYGSMTLHYVANKYNVPVNTIAADLKIPENLADEKLGRLKRLYPFTMDDVRNSISNYKKKNK
jgi:glucan phosphoethanolaminetransferase (alkaline phosphatase superfamily)